MRKIGTLLGTFCAIAALASCEKNEVETAPSTRPVTITLTRGDEASDTRTTITKEESGFKRVWAADDAVSVIYTIDGTSYNDKFVLSSGAGTTVATFTCAESHLEGTLYQVRVLYPYTNKVNSSGLWLQTPFDVQGDGSLENLGKYDVMLGTGNFAEGTFTQVGGKMSYLPFFFRIPAGVQLLNMTGTAVFDLNLAGTGDTKLYNFYELRLSSIGGSYTAGTISLGGITLSDGKVVKDIYIAAITEHNAGESFDLSLTSGGVTKSFNFSRASDKYLEPGTIYNLQQTNFTPQDWE